MRRLLSCDALSTGTSCALARCCHKAGLLLHTLGHNKGWLNKEDEGFFLNKRDVISNHQYVRSFSTLPLVGAPGHQGYKGALSQAL